MIYAYNIFKIQDADINKIKNFCSAKTDAGNNVKYESAKSCVESLVSILRNF